MNPLNAPPGVACTVLLGVMFMVWSVYSLRKALKERKVEMTGLVIWMTVIFLYSLCLDVYRDHQTKLYIQGLQTQLACLEPKTQPASEASGHLLFCPPVFPVLQSAEGLPLFLRQDSSWYLSRATQATGPLSVSYILVLPYAGNLTPNEKSSPTAADGQGGAERKQ
jgi:hypothetical protein